MKLFLLPAVLLACSGCASEWVIPECRADGKTPCVGQCQITVDTQTVADVPLAVRVRTAEGKLACEEIREL